MATGIINVGYLNANNYTAVDGSGTATITTTTISVSQQYNQIYPSSGTVGTVTNIQLAAAAGTALSGNLPKITLRCGVGTFIEFTHTAPGTANYMLFNSGQSFHLNGSKTLELQRTAEGYWASTEGIQIGSGEIVTTTAPQTLSNKAIANGNLTGTLKFDGSVFGGGSDYAYYGLQIGTKTSNATPITAGSIALGANRVMNVVAYVNGMENVGSFGVGGRYSAFFRRDVAGSIVRVGTETPWIVEDATGSPTFEIDADTSNNTARLRLTGVAGSTIHWMASVFYFQNGINVS